MVGNTKSYSLCVCNVLNFLVCCSLISRMSCFLHCVVSFCDSGGILKGVFAFRMLEINWLLQCVMRATSAVIGLYAGSIKSNTRNKE